MTNRLTAVLVALVLLASGLLAAPASAAGVTASASAYAAPGAPGAETCQPLRPVAGGDSLGIGEVLHLDTDHLLVLGIGIVGGVLVIGPWLGTGELLSALVGFIGAEALYRSRLWPFDRSRGWFSF